MITASAEYGPVHYVAQNMREKDREEIFATRWDDSAQDVAADVVASGPFNWVAFNGGEPVAVVGAAPLWPGVWSVHMFATEAFGGIAISLTKFVRRVMIPALTESGAHRAQCDSLVGHEKAHYWLEALGARQEGVLRGYGRQGEDFVRYVWSKE